MKNYFVLILFAMLFLTACKKERIDQYPDFIGVWYGLDSGAEYSIFINQDGSASYERVKGTSNTNIGGRFGIKKNGRMKIGIKGFDIDAYPADSSIDGVWTMELDGVTYSSFR